MTVEADPFGGGLVTINMNGKATTYRTRMIRVTGSSGVRLRVRQGLRRPRRLEPPYHLTCSSPDPKAAVIACECLGFLRWAGAVTRTACGSCSPRRPSPPAEFRPRNLPHRCRRSNPDPHPRPWRPDERHDCLELPGRLRPLHRDRRPGGRAGPPAVDLADRLGDDYREWSEGVDLMAGCPW